MMKTSENGRKLIEQFEGLILTAYDDYNDRIVSQGSHPRGTLTIGYGHTSSAGLPEVFVGQTITASQADEILGADLGKVENEVNSLVKVPLNQNQFDALVSFQFNTGALGHSSALTDLNKGDYAGCTWVMSEYIHANGQTLPGLVRRRKAETDLFNTAPKLGSAPPKPVQPTKQTLLGVLYEFLLKLMGRH